MLAALHPGLDNLTFVGERLFVSSFTGEITEILGTGETRTTLPGGLTWPLGLAVDADGDLYIADGTYFYVLLADGTLRVGGMLFSAGYPGFLRGVAALGSGEFAVTTSNGEVARYRPWASESEVLATGLDQLYGVAVAGSGALFVAERGAGRVLSVRPDGVEVMASGLSDPVGVAVTADGRCVVTEADAGRVRTLGDTGTLLDGLQCPQGVAICDRQVYVIDSGAKQLVAVDLGSRTRHTIAWDLPVGAPAGVTPSRCAECRRSPARRDRSPQSRPGRTQPSTSPPTRMAAYWHCAGNPEGRQSCPSQRSSITAIFRWRGRYAKRSWTVSIRWARSCRPNTSCVIGLP